MTAGISKIGFTGTRHGMSNSQYDAFADYVSGLVRDFASQEGSVRMYGLHGGCVGADVEFHNLCVVHLIRTIVLPGYSAKSPDDMTFRANLVADETRDPMTHFARNRVIVQECDILLACPHNDSGKGGTWYTINYARKTGVECIVFDR